MDAPGLRNGYFLPRRYLRRAWMVLSAILACNGPNTPSKSPTLSDAAGTTFVDGVGDAFLTSVDLVTEVADGSLILQWSKSTEVDFWLIYYRADLPGPPWDGDQASNGPSPLVVAAELSTFTLTGLSNDRTVYLRLVGFVSEQAVAQSDIVKATPRRDATAQVLIPAGIFWMGTDDLGAASDESPRHAVYLDAFWMDRYMATNADYRKCVDLGLCPQPASTSGYIGNLVSVPDYFDNPVYDSWPAVFLSHDAAVAYCSASGKRLPTEAEWERVARGNSKGSYPWGEASPDCSVANFVDEGAFCVGGPQPVGTFSDPDVAFGVADIVGNVWQWTHDWYSPVAYRSSLCLNPTGPTEGTERVLRGGAWYYDVSALHVTHRNHWNPRIDTASAEFGGYFGFGVRCVRTAVGVPCDSATQFCELPVECRDHAPDAGPTSYADTLGDAIDTADTIDTIDTIDGEVPDVGGTADMSDSEIEDTPVSIDALEDAADIGTAPCKWVQDDPKNLAACVSTPAPQCPSGWPNACPIKPCSCAVAIFTDAPECGKPEFDIEVGWRDLQKNFHEFDPAESVEICEGFQGGIHITAAMTVVAPNEVADVLYADIYALAVINGVVVAGLAKENHAFLREDEGHFESKNQQIRFEGCTGDEYTGMTAEVMVLIRTKDGRYGTTTATIPLKNDLNGPFLDGINPC